MLHVGWRFSWFPLGYSFGWWQVLLDICCGTGTLGIVLASAVSRVIGIEMNASAVADARWLDYALYSHT